MTDARQLGDRKKLGLGLMNFTKLMETVLSLLFGPSHQRFSRNPEVACSSGLRISHGWAEAALSRTHLQATQRGDSSRAATEGNPAPAQMHRGHALAEGPLGMAYDCASDVAGFVRVLHVEKVTEEMSSPDILGRPSGLTAVNICIWIGPMSQEQEHACKVSIIILNLLRCNLQVGKSVQRTMYRRLVFVWPHEAFQEHIEALEIDRAVKWLVVVGADGTDQWVFLRRTVSILYNAIGPIIDAFLQSSIGVSAAHGTHHYEVACLDGLHEHLERHACTLSL